MPPQMWLSQVPLDMRRKAWIGGNLSKTRRHPQKSAGPSAERSGSGMYNRALPLTHLVCPNQVNGEGRRSVFISGVDVAVQHQAK